MKILHICNHFYPCIGGVEKYVEDLCTNLRKHGFISDVLCLNTCSYSKERLPFYEERNGIKIYRIPYINLKYYKIAPSVLKFAKNYDILHVHGIGFFSDFLLLTKLFHQKPVIVSGHGGIFHTKKFLPVKKIYFKVWTRITLKFADCVIAESKNNYDLFSRICKPVLIPYSIYYENFRLKRKEEKNSFLFVGRISRNKRIDNLIKTFYYLKKLAPSVKLYIVGGDWEGIKKELENLVSKLELEKNVFFIGEKRGKSLLEYYAKARFFVSASQYEGFGISVIEAMAAGCVPIVNDIEAFRHFVKHERNGFILNFSNHKESAEKIQEIMRRNDLERIRRNARETARKYDWDNAIRKLIKIYKNLDYNSF